MSTVRDVITLALEQCREIGEDMTPSAGQARRGLEAFQSMLDMWVIGGMFGSLEDTFLEEDDTAGEGRRYYLNGYTLTFSNTIDDECGHERQVRDLALVETVTIAGVRSVRLFDRTEWVELTGLTLNSDAPLVKRGLSGLAACLARAYAEMFGGQIGPNTQRLAAVFEGSLSGKMGSTQDRSPVEYF